MELQETKADFWHHWMMSQSHGLNTEAWRGVMCVLRWLSIREDNSIPPPGRFHHMEDDISHSALLRRLIDGKDPLPDPPPESYGQPWYELMENGQSTDVQVAELEWGNGTHLIINESLWKILRQDGPDAWYITYRRGSHLFRLQREGDGFRLVRQN